MSIIPRLRSNRQGIFEFFPFLNRKRAIADVQKKLADPLTFFLMKKRGVTVIGQWLLPRPRESRYWKAEIVHIASNADSWHPNISSK